MVMESSISLPCGADTGAPDRTRPRSGADRRMRRLLRLPEDASRASVVEAQNAFSKSVFISAARCVFTYLLVPIFGPLIGLHGSVGPVLGLAIGVFSMVCIVAAVRRFFRADHKWRWRYTAIASGITVLLTAQAVIDIVALAT